MKNAYLAGVAFALGFASVATMASAQSLTIYSGRGEALIGPLVAQFEAETGIDAEVRYGSTAEMAALLMEEGENTPADLFWAQDAGALGALAPHFSDLAAGVNETVLPVFRDPSNKWVATSGRTRVLVYSTDRVEEGALPAAITDLTDEAYRGRVAWAPTNGSFQAFVTAFRLTHGDDAAKAWLEGMIANETKVYRNNGTQIEGIANGEVDFGLVNNYYLGRYTAADAEYPVDQTHFGAGDIGNLVLVAGAGVIDVSDNKDNAQAFIDFLLSPAAQQYITLSGNEYPVREGIIPQATLEPLATVQEISPAVNVNDIGDLEGTLSLLRDVGLL
ncbi:ferric iron ABC transporter iron-binding protein (plasmid) [Ketogulonicigenium vulgare Y25]|uniref:ABC-type Fe3+ transport system, periplasmic component n=1 Tax=Ketogulonicigenium vulgare (strain WSH-001) TaxID=759362 RepID=F9YBQ7_KETVW|nr:iron ABC transporter substrate-binding protein [Ketogulonicigenium vulgare]ADO44372.1 ferric iron ABC transporter iron-binding protein [Ketogulonicigenium vulgare Y25]AEM42809.1 ABC-type Fe3+ transport system, periplasmic component [Ketogulonicigenium vulgare WSH-001]ALJ82875.1 ABC transporter substrate-binding protein [Ketogulonicigenium vulgare]